MCADDAERQGFLSALARLSQTVDQSRSPVVVVLGLRADFYGRAARERVLVPVLEDHQVIVGAMSTDELKRAIAEPARLARVDVDSALVDLLVGEFIPRGSQSGRHDPGALPLLSHALQETFKRSSRSRMTVGDYRLTGGIGDAIGQTAERSFAALTKDEQALARRVFLRLVSVNDDATITRRRLPRAELPTALPGDAGGDETHAQGALARVLNRFVAHRLLTVTESTVEVSHEALLAAWPRLRSWLDADLEGLRIHRQLSEASRMWAQSEHDPSGLLRGGRLDAARAWALRSDRRGDLNEQERSFLDASERDDRRRTRRRQVLMALVATLAVVASSFAVLAANGRNAAEHVRDLALSRQVALEANQLRSSDPSLAAQLAVASYRIAVTPEARSALLDSSATPTPSRLVGEPGTTAMAVSGDGATLAVGRAIDRSVQLYTFDAKGEPVKRGVLRATAAEATPYSVAFSPSGSIVAVGVADGGVRLWDISSPSEPRLLGAPLSGFAGKVFALAFSSDGKTLAAVGTATGIARWDVAVPAHPVALASLTPTAETTVSVAYGAGGRALAAGGTDGTVRLWSPDESGRTVLAELRNPAPTTINSVAFSPDGRILVAGSKRKTIQRWDVSNPASPTEIGEPLTGFSSWVNSVAFSPDGRTMAAGSSDSTIRIWDVATWRPRVTPLPNPAPVTVVAFLPLPDGGSRLASAAADGAARLWSEPGPVIDGASDSIFALMYSADGRRLAVVPTRDSIIPLWDTSTPGHPRRLGQVTLSGDLGVPGGSGAISPDGRILAAGTSKGFVQLFDIADPTRPVPLGQRLVQSTSLVEQVTFSRDGRLLGAGGDDNTVVIWDVSDAANPVQLGRLEGATDSIFGIAFSGDGKLIAVASTDKTVRLWSVSSPLRKDATAILTGFDDYASSVTFSPDSQLLAAGGVDKTVRLWDIADPSRPRSLGVITGPSNAVNNVAIDPGGRTLAAAVSGGSVWRWDITDPARPRHTATLRAQPGDLNVLTYSPDGRTLASAGSDRTVYLWSTDERQVAHDVCAAAGDPITRREWSQYLPNRPYKPPCSS